MKLKLPVLMGLSMLYLMTSCQQNTVYDVDLDSRIDSVSYSIGLIYGLNLSREGIDSLNPYLIGKGFDDLYRDQDFLMDEAEAEAILRAFFAEMQEGQMLKEYGDIKEEGEKFLEENKAREDVVTLPSGLQYLVLEEGTGPKPQETDVVKVYYKGSFVDGSVFEETPEGEPVSFPVNRVIRGWTEALQLMPVGSKWRLFIPYDLAYGTQYREGSPILPYSTLVFDVELLGIEEQ
jgi:FKBP-type peptidyl-prolyl cis-trans isomerase FklB